ncbi:hypothetical protein OsI_16014 [Oryza sativa Indica Group]|uniref:F-box domain-containing protein n=2 Tax=Oryza sativa TaxID=4530 RepID=B9FCI6_ORYSJ|nr:hypothetical protein OsI_16014 [Oryza sativa Indica Group]EEE61691.1 hypothetical protein OsJ_16165 [Oryza sativa Japonica Group]
MASSFRKRKTGWLILHPWRPRGRGAVQTPSPPATDRLSALPDALLHTILSSLKGRQMVQTSVLSKRWRHLWRSVPCLDIDQREFAAASENWAISRSDLEKFEDFADNVLAYRCGSPAKLDTFRLRICDRYHSLRSSDTDRWIRRGLKCSPREFHLHFDYRYDSYLLEMHKLGSNYGCLTKLHLTNVSLHECFMEHITTVCTLLEVLELNRCSLYLQEITHPKLKNLVLHGPAVYDEDELPVRLEFNQVEFHAFKNLRTLLLDRCRPSYNNELLRHLLQNSPNLEKLTVHCCKFSKGSLEWRKSSQHKNQVNCRKLKSTEIIYKDIDDVRELVDLLLDVSGHLPKNTIALTKI